MKRCAHEWAIATEERAGRQPAQAEAIAFATARRAKKKPLVSLQFKKR